MICPQCRKDTDHRFIKNVCQLCYLYNYRHTHVQQTRDYYKEHRDKYIERGKFYRKLDKNKHNLRKKEHRQRQKFRFIELYGCKCVICGENRPKMLTLDHINNDKAEDKKRFKSTTAIYTNAIKNFDNNKYRILCWNCNCSRPHISVSKHRLKFIQMYCGKCVSCGITDALLLTLDHINNDGYLEHNEAYIRALSNYNPNKYQILCWNCNCGKNQEDLIAPPLYHKNNMAYEQIMKPTP